MNHKDSSKKKKKNPLELTTNGQICSLMFPCFLSEAAEVMMMGGERKGEVSKSCFNLTLKKNLGDAVVCFCFVFFLFYIKILQCLM